MRLSVIFGTRGNDFAFPHLQRIFRALQQQTFQDFQVIVVIDRKFEEKAERNTLLNHWEFEKKFRTIFTKTAFFTNINSDFRPPSHNASNASYVRNYGIAQADTELIQLFDDDNDFDETYLETAITTYDEKKKHLGTEVVICPTLKYRNTEIIQNQGFSHFRYREGRPIINLLGNQHSAKIQMFSGNGLLGTSQLFQSVSYDENIARIAEDLDFTLSLYERGVQLFVFSDLSVHHYEREKTKLEQAWIGSPSQAHQKARNWFLFVRKHGTLSNKLAFLCIGLPGCLIWLSRKALFYGGKKGFSIIRGLFRGVRDGWRAAPFFTSFPT